MRTFDASLWWFAPLHKNNKSCWDESLIYYLVQRIHLWESMITMDNRNILRRLKLLDPKIIQNNLSIMFWLLSGVNLLAEAKWAGKTQKSHIQSWYVTAGYGSVGMRSRGGCFGSHKKWIHKLTMKCLPSRGSAFNCCASHWQNTDAYIVEQRRIICRK